MQPERCPTCRGFNWYRDGFRITEDDEGRLRSERFEPASADAPTCWCCSLCGHELPNWSAMARSLDALKAVRMTEIGPADAGLGARAFGEVLAGEAGSPDDHVSSGT